MLVATSAVAMAAPTAKAPLLADAVDAPIEDAEWTIMVYLDADNNLEANGFDDLAEMEAVGSIAGVNVVVLFDAYTTFEGSHWFYIAPGSDHILDDGTIQCDCERIAPDHKCPGELNMAAGETLTYFVENAVEYATADHYYLDLWDHGGGWWGICYDDGSLLPDGRTDRLDMDEVSGAIGASGVHLDVIGYDACFMGMVEVAYENRNIADYMVASITTMPGAGYDYTLFLSAITGLENKVPVDVCSVTVDAYIEAYSLCAGAGVGGFPYVSSSVFDLEKVVDLVGVTNPNGGLNALGNALYGLADDYYLRGLIQSSESVTPQLQFMGEQFPFTDIGYFVTQLGERIPELSAIATETFEMLDAAVLHCNSVVSDMGTPLKTTGMSVYYTICFDHLYENYRTVGLDFVDDTMWDEFLFAFSMVYDG
jgi:hypothetical protein